MFGGNPRTILFKVIRKDIKAVISDILTTELLDTLIKKFSIKNTDLLLIKSQIKDNFILVYPTNEINICRDVDDNRVLEAAVEGKCKWIITGDKDLLDLKRYKNIKLERHLWI